MKWAKKPVHRSNPARSLPETSINKELGVEYVGDNGLGASLTYFHNDYRNKVDAGRFAVDSFTALNNQQLILQWENIPKADFG